jgi:hypothetical protein
MPNTKRKGYVVIVLPPSKAKSRQRSRLRATRRPVRGDRLITSEEAIWLRA